MREFQHRCNGMILINRDVIVLFSFATGECGLAAFALLATTAASTAART